MEANKKNGIYYMTGGFYIVIIAVLSVITFWFNRYLAIGELALSLVLFAVNYIYKRHTKKKISEMFEQMTLDIGSATGNALLDFPLAALIVEEDGKIKWYNDAFSKAFNEEHLYDKELSALVPELNPESFFKGAAAPVQTTVSCNGKSFRVFGSIPQGEDKKGKIVVLYFDEITEFVDLKRKYHEEKTFECLIFVDNYDELMESTPNSAMPQLQALLYKTINDWASEHDGILIKYEKDKYCVLFEARYMESFIKDKFSILSEIRAINEGNTIQASVSIGIGLNGANLVENDAFAKAAINMALGRGGDQAVIKDNEQFRFYGGNSKEYEKSTRVKARVVSNALSGLIADAESIVVMSHKGADVDSLGAAFGVYRMARMQEKPVHVLLESYDQTVKNMLDRLEHVEEYAGLFINVQQAASRVTKNTLIIVVDTHKPSLLEDASLLKKAGQIVVIDHHRRGTEFIENTALIYHEPYASSASEMLTEVLQYSSSKMSLTKLEAECLYAGIVVDTKSFTFKTGVRTFEAASYLRKQGVDTVAIKTMFQQDLNSYIKRASIIREAEIYRENMAISATMETDKNIHLLVAQAADELLNIKGITASFVLYATEKGVSISGRSLGNMNVQVILEKLGGGGHLTIAGAQLSDLSIKEAREQLCHAIDEYISETSN